jgi:hypothetical protein
MKYSYSIKVVVFFFISILIIYLFLGNSWRGEIEHTPVKILPHLGSYLTAESSSGANKTSDCASAKISPFGNSLNNCNLEQSSSSTDQQVNRQQEISTQDLILTRITSVADKFDLLQKSSPPESLYSLIMMADECRYKTIGNNLSQSAACTRIMEKRQAAEEALEQSAESQNQMAQYLYGTLLHINASSGTNSSLDPVKRAGDYKKGIQMIRLAAASGHELAQSTIEFIDSIPKPSVVERK